MAAAGDVVPGIRVQLYAEDGGPIITSEPVRGRDVAEAMAELGFTAGLRRGGPPLALSDLSGTLRPRFGKTKGGERYCSGFSLETSQPSDKLTCCHFDRDLFEPVATRASRRLVEEGLLAKGDLYYFEIDIDSEETLVGPIDIDGFTEPPRCAELEIGPFIARSRWVPAYRRRGLIDEAYAREQLSSAGWPGSRAAAPVDGAAALADDDEVADDGLHYPVFYATGALEKAERVSRKGAARVPAVETGGLLLGRLCVCPETRQLFGVIDDVIEASGSEGTTYTLTFTAKTWARVQAVLAARQRNPATRSQRVLGQVHGHSFLPYDRGETCDGCPSQGKCQLSTAFLSLDDRSWCRSVFPREPWQLSHVFGLTPRREPVSAFYGQHGAALERRGYYVLADSPPPETP